MWSAVVPDTDDADADRDDDAGPCEDIVVIAKTHGAASEDTHSGSDDGDIEHAHIYICIHINGFRNKYFLLV